MKSNKPLIIEFAGMPKSGKSSSVRVATDYLSRKGHMLRVYPEGAIACPFSKRYREEFACWIADRALNTVLEVAFSNDNLIALQDRGLFDSLAFIKLLHLERLIEQRTLDSYLEYFSSSKWTRHVDLVLLFDISPEESVARDLARTLSGIPGVVTNAETLWQLANAYDFLVDQYGDGFSQIIRIDTTGVEQLKADQLAIKNIEEVIQRSSK